MSKDDVIKRFCILASKVGREVFDHQLPHDCFCNDGARIPDFRFDPEIMHFIESAVEYAIEKDEWWKKHERNTA